METSAKLLPRRSSTGPLSPGSQLVFALSCGVAAGNMYYAQPLIGLIAPALSLDTKAAGLLVTFTQVGYCTGLILLVPLVDLIDSRRLVPWTIAGGAIALAIAAVAPSAPMFLTCSFFIGAASTAAQMLISVVAHAAPDENRGGVVGNITAGFLAGVMLARPAASFIAASFGWRSVFFLAALAMFTLALVLRRSLLASSPTNKVSYWKLIASLWALLCITPALQRNAVRQAMLFAAFALFWTAVPLELAGPSFGLSQKGIGLFALAAAAGALSAPVAGRASDRGWGRLAAITCVSLALLAFLVSGANKNQPLILLIGGALMVDAGVEGHQVIGQRTIHALDPNKRGRLNALYVTIFFVGGAVGSAASGLIFSINGWGGVCSVGAIACIVALATYIFE